MREPIARRIVATVSHPGDPSPALDDALVLRARLAIACERRDREPPFSPDWDAAMDEIDELTVRIARAEAGSAGPG